MKQSQENKGRYILFNSIWIWSTEANFAIPENNLIVKFSPWDSQQFSFRVSTMSKNVKKWKSRTPDRKRFHLVKIWLTAKRLAIFTLNNAVSTSAISRWGLDRIKKEGKVVSPQWILNKKWFTVQQLQTTSENRLNELNPWLFG